MLLSWQKLAFTASAITLLVGCASPANPRAPSLHLQEVAAAPQATRVGDEVHLAWTTPVATTDGGRPELPLIAVLCREDAALPQTGCNAIGRAVTAPGADGQMVDVLPPALLGARSLLAYRLEIQNRRGRSAGFSAPALAVAGPAPAAAGPLTITAQPGGALVTWAPAAGSAGAMELTRTVSGGLPARPAGKPAPALAADPAAPVLLRSAPAPGLAVNGMLDPAVLDARSEGTAYSYVGQRVETIKMGPQTLELRGLPSPPAGFTYVHSFAPAAPSGLLAVPALAPPSIDLSWEPSLSPDLLGYNVYRRSGAEPSFRLLNAKPVAVPSFRDGAVITGRIYTYRVTTLDRHHNQSAASVEVQETVTP